MNRITCLLIVVWMVAISCRNKNTCTITGTVTNGKDTTILYLESDSLPGVDSIMVVNGTFKHQLQLAHPMEFTLHNKRNQYEFRDWKTIWLEPSQISLTGDLEFIKNLKVEGSASQKVYKEYLQLYDSLEKKIKKYDEKGLMAFIEERESKGTDIDSLRKELSKSIVGYMTGHLDSYVVLSILYRECNSPSTFLDKEQFKDIYSLLPERFQTTVMGKQIKKYYELPEPPKVGEMAPDIIQVNPRGDTIRLSDFRGKYVLVDFWASWCAPCRSKFEWLRKVYSKYQPQGLEILGVSGDFNKQAWVNAIEHDSISWVNVSDLKGWHNDAFMMYGIYRIPHKLLVNPEGFIIKKGDCFIGESTTESVLNEIFESKTNLRKNLRQ